MVDRVGQRVAIRIHAGWGEVIGHPIVHAGGGGAADGWPAIGGHGQIKRRERGAQAAIGDADHNPRGGGASIGAGGRAGQGAGCGAEIGPAGGGADRIGQRVAIPILAGWREAIGAVCDGHEGDGGAADGRRYIVIRHRPNGGAGQESQTGRTGTRRVVPEARANVAAHIGLGQPVSEPTRTRNCSAIPPPPRADGARTVNARDIQFQGLALGRGASDGHAILIGYDHTIRMGCPIVMGPGFGCRERLYQQNHRQNRRRGEEAH